MQPIIENAVESSSGIVQVLWIIIAALCTTIAALVAVIRHLYKRIEEQEIARQQQDKEYREDIERLSKARQRERNSR